MAESNTSKTVAAATGVFLLNFLAGPSWLGVPAYALAFFFFRSRQRRGTASRLCLALLVSSLVKAAAVAYLFSLPYCESQELRSRYFAYVLLWDTSGAQEQQVLAAIDELTPTWDSFACAPPRSIDGVRYSIGPDRVDDGLAIIYNAANGTVSRGDIIIPADNSGQ